MKTCYVCGHEQPADKGLCSCGYAPTRSGKIVFFDAEAIAGDDGFSIELHDALDDAQSQSFWFKSRNELIRRLALAFFSDAQTLIEVGCGTGFVLKMLQAAFPEARLTGSELYGRALEHATKRVGDAVELLQFDVRRMPFENEFDVICAFDVLEHIDEDVLVLEKFRRALRPSGGLLLSVPQHPFLWSRADELWFHKRRYRRGELEAKCERAGFKVIFSSSFVMSLLPMLIVQRLVMSRKAKFDPYDGLRLPGFIDRIFEKLLRLEARLISAGISLPMGGSRFVVARKN